MEKIKNLLSPGKQVDDETLYGSGHGGSPISHHSSKDSGVNPQQDDHQLGYAVSHNGRIDQQSTIPSAAVQDSSLNAPQTPIPVTGVSNTSAAQDRDSRSYAGATVDRDGDQVSTSATPGTLRPEHTVPVRDGPNASTKSNVIRRVPMGSSLTQEQGNLPKVPATDGKFMNDEALMVDVPPHPPQSNTDRAFPLAASTVATAGTSNAHGPHQTFTATKLDPNIESTSAAPISDPQPLHATATQDHHLGRDAAIIGTGAGAGAPALGAYGAYKRDETARNTTSEPSTLQEPNAPLGTTSLPAASTQSSVPNTIQQSQPLELQEDISLRHMPGAYPETPAIEAEKTLGRDAASSADASTAAVIATQTGSKGHGAEQPSSTHGSVNDAEANPYLSTLDPRVDSIAKYAAAPSTTGGTITSSSTAAQIGNGQDEVTGPQGSFGKKIEEVQAKEDNHGRDFAIAGATAATAAGTYEVAKRHAQEPASSIPTDQRSFVAQQPSTAQRSETGTIGTASAAVPSSLPSVTNEPTKREFPLKTSHDASSVGKATNFSYPTSAKDVTVEAGEEKSVEYHDFPKNAAKTGAAGAAGLGAYEAMKQQGGHAASIPTHEIDDPLASSAHPKALESYDDQRAVPTHEAHIQGHTPESYYGRDAVLVCAGAGAAELASRKPYDSKLEKEREKTAERRHEDFERDEREIRKSEEKHRRSEEKHRNSENKDHKHGLIHRILHPHKSKEGLDKEKEPRSPSEKSRSSYNKSSYDRSSLDRSSYDKQDDDSLVAVVDTATPEHSKHDLGRNKLHKDPPPGYQSK